MYIEYRVPVQGIKQENRIRIQSNRNDISNITLTLVETDKLFDDLYIRFYFLESLSDINEMESITRPELEDIINLVIYRFNASFKTPKVHGYETFKNKVFGTGSIELINLTQCNLKETDLDWLQTEIKLGDLTQRLNSNVNFILYRSTLSIEDEVARFLLLYAVLYEIKGTQTKVDKYIQGEEPTIKMLSSTKKGKKKEETVYTWWRNQAQHIQEDTDFEEVKKKFKELVNPLKELVFEAVKNKIQ